MCGPAIAVAAFQTALSLREGRKAVRQSRADAELDRISAEQAAARQYRGLSERRQEGREHAADEIEALARQAIRASGIAKLGGAGASVSAIISDISRQLLMGTAKVKRNEEHARSQLELDFQAVSAQKYGRIEQIRRRVLPEPNLLAAFLNIAAAGVKDIDLGSDVVDTPATSPSIPVTDQSTGQTGLLPPSQMSV
jgi:hypothetical protein